MAGPGNTTAARWRWGVLDLVVVAVAIIAFVFVKLFGTAAPGSDEEGRR